MGSCGELKRVRDWGWGGGVGGLRGVGHLMKLVKICVHRISFISGPTIHKGFFTTICDEEARFIRDTLGIRPENMGRLN